MLASVWPEAGITQAFQISVNYLVEKSTNAVNLQALRYSSTPSPYNTNNRSFRQLIRIAGM